MAEQDSDSETPQDSDSEKVNESSSRSRFGSSSRSFSCAAQAGSESEGESLVRVQVSTLNGDELMVEVHPDASIGQLIDRLRKKVLAQTTDEKVANRWFEGKQLVIGSRVFNFKEDVYCKFLNIKEVRSAKKQCEIDGRKCCVLNASLNCSVHACVSNG